MNITVIAVGKLKEKYLKDGIAEYAKRLKPYCNLNIVEIAEEIIPESPSFAGKNQALRKEGSYILEKINPASFVISLCIEGERFTSEKMAKKIEGIMTSGTSHITFIIGSSMGLSEEVKEKAHLKLSFSDFTFPHQLMRLILLEQIYRWFKIIRGETYHK
ncbi:MAG: 23S rRNA (pseudouridine(1915)-N(3))-methyltransferase RlmH [Tepidanaerobacteraceae bacterium]|jgi:23S rRNA (pseudouridine1915-N3)-methyltransferase|nr:23S rRNA (pseudouridine(1915)-N(3))-methyltransferase RlmH [Tepidanaerobacteraceae bacterium]